MAPFFACFSAGNAAAMAPEDEAEEAEMVRAEAPASSSSASSASSDSSASSASCSSASASLQAEIRRAMAEAMASLQARIAAMEGDLAREIGYPLASRLILEVSCLFDAAVHSRAPARSPLPNPNPWGWAQRSHEFKRALLLHDPHRLLPSDARSVDAIALKAAHIMAHSNSYASSSFLVSSATDVAMYCLLRMHAFERAAI
jgi:hypothetical protein